MRFSILSGPCMACPYRKDVASGVWALEEYAKLLDYDKPTGEQPVVPFACHATPDKLCHGWAVCHSNRGSANELLVLRILGLRAPEPKAPLFKSGAAAAKHGLKDIAKQKRKAKATQDKLLKKYKRLKTIP